MQRLHRCTMWCQCTPMRIQPWRGARWTEASACQWHLASTTSKCWVCRRSAMACKTQSVWHFVQVLTPNSTGVGTQPPSVPDSRDRDLACTSSRASIWRACSLACPRRCMDHGFGSEQQPAAPSRPYTSAAQFTQRLELYRGSVSTVYRAMDEFTHRRVILKCYHKTKMQVGSSSSLHAYVKAVYH